jgi:response regulator of citrate/malate metabolism
MYRLGHGRYLINPFQFIRRHTTLTLYSLLTESVIKKTHENKVKADELDGKRSVHGEGETCVNPMKFSGKGRRKIRSTTLSSCA